MLQVSPDAELETETDERTDDAIYCARCHGVVTRGRWALSVDGHEHVFFNPAGVVYRIVCFTEAPGAADIGEPTDEFTWFKGYLWSFALCAGCGEHLGWRYAGDGDPAVFFGLIKNRLSAAPPAGRAAPE
ncbi:MAG: cereblon family protein [Magnetovibrio sp.]|nr:cereblon family protein [Magnetovibrio sp.]